MPKCVVILVSQGTLWVAMQVSFLMCIDEVSKEVAMQDVPKSLKM